MGRLPTHPRHTHNWEIRTFKNQRKVRSYKDSQGFRSYDSPADEQGKKRTILKVEVPIYHYSYTRLPRLMRQKFNYFHRFWHNNTWLAKHTATRHFDYNEVDRQNSSKVATLSSYKPKLPTKTGRLITPLVALPCS